MSKTKTPIKNTSVPSAYDTPMTTLEYLRKVESQNAQVLSRAGEIEEALDGKVAKSGDTMTGTLNLPQVNANTGVFHDMNVVSQDERTHVEADNNGFVAEVNVTDLNKKYGVIALPNGKVGFYAHDSAHNKDVNFIIPNMDEYEAGTYELATKDDIPEPSGGGDFIFSKSGSFNQNVIVANSHAILRLSRNMLVIDIKGSAYTGNVPAPVAPNGYTYVTFTFTEEEMNEIVSTIDANPNGNLCTGAFKYSTTNNGLLFGHLEFNQSSRQISVRLIGNTGEWPSTATGNVFYFDIESIILGVSL